MKKVFKAVCNDGSTERLRHPRLIGEILNEYFLQGNAPLAVAYRKHLAERKAKVASTVTSNQKGGHDGKNRL